MHALLRMTDQMGDRTVHRLQSTQSKEIITKIVWNPESLLCETLETLLEKIAIVLSGSTKGNCISVGSSRILSGIANVYGSCEKGEALFDRSGALAFYRIGCQVV